MSKLNQFIKDHAGMFDDQEPGTGHFDRFDERLNQLHTLEPKPATIHFWMKIAAGILILVTAGLVIFELATRDFTGRTTLQQAAIGLPQDLVELLSIYENRTGQQMTELNQLAQNCPDGPKLVDDARKEIDQLDRNLDELVTAIKENPDNDRVQAALIQNCKAKESLLNDAILSEKIRKCE
ncbi:MAG: hypothetical protein D4R67_08070 [Bacteroidetes bacterium]|nr:MAG: hypothetical protein D4R67_08070 [Bacteroidota bacterium]